ncbi:hypothetical protein [Luteolibacter marinus]|uniref:hypothetical protein n=1 Tax=Luteolibacter marinus TaxID=2776705 RepID=UPI001866C5A4|nr:hypothetical protein [Luteolibacter marinus]
MIGERGSPLAPVADILEGWDYQCDLELNVEIEVDFQGAADALEIPSEELRLEAVLKVGTGSGTMPRRIEILDRVVLNSGRAEAKLEATLDSSNLSGRLLIECGIVLGKPAGNAGGISPRWQASRLWSERRDVLIEDGGASRFPIESVSFKRSFPGAPFVAAPWYIDWQPGMWRLDFGGSVRLYVNSDFPGVGERVVEGDPLTLQAILADVMRQMISLAVTSADCDEMLEDLGEGSVGHQVRNWMDLAFPGQSASSIASLAEHRPGRFSAAILSAAEVSMDP